MPATTKLTVGEVDAGLTTCTWTVPAVVSRLAGTFADSEVPDEYVVARLVMKPPLTHWTTEAGTKP